jgi:hypothetical protein
MTPPAVGASPYSSGPQQTAPQAGPGVSAIPAAYVPQQSAQAGYGYIPPSSSQSPYKKDYGLSDLKAGFKTAMEQGKEEFSGRWSKYKNK